MSAHSLMKHRMNVKELTRANRDGIPDYKFSLKATGIRCFLDLNFITVADRPLVTVEAGRGPDRAGTLFFPVGTDLNPGDQIELTRPAAMAGQFQLIGQIRQEGSPSRISHLAVTVQEVAKPLGRE